MIRSQRPKHKIALRKFSGSPEPQPCSPGSIEQELDMCEGKGVLKGDDLSYSHGREPAPYLGDPRPLDQVINQEYSVDMSEVDREGDEMSGDEHSAGLQGGEPDIEHQMHLGTGLPGDRTAHEDLETRLPDVAPEEEVIERATPKRKAG